MATYESVSRVFKPSHTPTAVGSGRFSFNSLIKSTTSVMSEQFKKWLADIDINYADLDEEKRVKYKEPVAQRNTPLFEKDTPANVRYVIQIKVLNIDGIKTDLVQDHGFRNYVVRVCRQIGLSGFVWRVPRSDGIILALGTPAQLRSLLQFMKDLMDNGYIENYTIENNKQEYRITSDQFSLMPSRRQKVVTGRYSDPSHDDVASVKSADSSEVSFAKNP
eukprot:gene1137-1533_t